MPKSLSDSALWALLIFVGIVVGLVLGQWQCFRFIPQITLGQALQTATLLLIFLTAHRFLREGS